MPRYEFQSVDSPRKVITRFFRADRAPELGTLISEGGRFFKRILSAPVGVTVHHLTRSVTVPDWSKGFVHDDQGRCYTKSPSHAKDCAKRNGMVGRDV